MTVPTLDGGVAGLLGNVSPTFPDFDGDGLSDWYPFSEPDAPTVTRPVGALKFARAGETLGVTVAGSLDREPGQEIWVFDTRSVAASGRAWVVPYATPEGTYDPADVGVRVPAGVPRPITDRTGDGVDDVLLVDRLSAPQHPTTDLLSGAEIIAAGVPGDARNVIPEVTFPGGVTVLADFGGAEPAIVTVDQGENLHVIVVRVFDGTTTTELTNAPSSFPGVSGTAVGAGGFTALRGGDGSFLTLTGGSRSGGITWWWSLDRPCSPLSAVGAGGPAAALPATPTVGTPRLTG